MLVNIVSSMGGSTAGRYWRIIANAASYNAGIGDHGLSLWEAEMFTSADASGSDLTTGKTGSVSSTSLNGLPEIIDDNVATAWSSANTSTTNQWFYVDFATPVVVHSLTITPAADGGGAYIGSSMKLQKSSNAVTWIDVATFAPTNTTTDAVKQTFTNL